MGLLKQIFTWWEGATITTRLHTWRHGNKVGSDALGNFYYTSKGGDRRRWVIYQGANDASRIPPDWYAWMHHMIDGPPDESLPPPPKFLREPTPNLTGTRFAYRPSGALERGAQRAAASGDYEAWTPDEA
jgi:NADH:ubiquinone oxidoreductase subunit